MVVIAFVLFHSGVFSLLENSFNFGSFLQVGTERVMEERVDEDEHDGIGARVAAEGADARSAGRE